MVWRKRRCLRTEWDRTVFGGLSVRAALKRPSHVDQSQPAFSAGAVISSRPSPCSNWLSIDMSAKREQNEYLAESSSSKLLSICQERTCKWRKTRWLSKRDPHNQASKSRVCQAAARGSHQERGKVDNKTSEHGKSAAYDHRQ